MSIELGDRFYLSLTDYVTIHGDEKIVFKFKNGAEVEEEI